MENYSHEVFWIAGYKISTTNKDHQSGKDIMQAWTKFRSENMADLIQGKSNPTIHCIYFNYQNPENIDERSYDMLIGFTTEEGALQDNEQITSIEIPKQDYKYTMVTGELPQALITEWSKINQMSSEELRRSYGYDMDMYTDDGVCLAVSVS